MPAEAEFFRLGVNYWPSDAAMDWLARYDAGIVRHDFNRIARAGMDTVRIFLRWEDLQPEAAHVDRAALARVVDTADAAAEAGVELIVTLFTGHMSGVNWIPAWASDGRDGDARFRVVSAGIVQRERRALRNWYADADVSISQAQLAASVAAALAGHPALWAWDLGNENSNCTIPPDPMAADRWLEEMSSVLRARDPRVLITVGTHMEDLENERMIGPTEATRWCDFVCMHGYPIYAEWSTGPTDEHVVPFLAEVTGWLAADTPVLFSEFGHPTAPIGQTPAGLQVHESDAAAYTGRTLDALRHCGSIGALVWCYTDYSPRLFDRPPLDLAAHERTFGLWRVDETPKPAVSEITMRRGRSCEPVADRRSWLDITVDEFAADRGRQLIRLYQRYRDRSDQADST